MTMRDRFTDACVELAEHNAYVCDSCETIYGHQTIMDHGENNPLHNLSGDPAACLINCDPVPFGD